jgi:hypothetical protein
VQHWRFGLPLGKGEGRRGWFPWLEILIFSLIAWASLNWVYAATPAEPQKPPAIPPYEIPTYSGEHPDFKGPIPAMRPAPQVDADGMFRMVVNCYPVKSKWQVELDAVAGTRYTDGDGGITTFDTSGLARHYVGLVAKMPLYSAQELDREREREYHRRTDTATRIAELLQALADRQRAQRELGLYTSLEARAQKRVAIGVAETTEQVSYLEKVATAQSNLDAARAKILGARLALVGQCRDEVLDEVNGYLMGVTGEMD